MSKNKKSKKDEEKYNLPSLSSHPQKNLIPLDEAKEIVFETINNAELQKSLDKWLKDNHFENKIISRDLTLLKSIITEYLDSFLLIGYSLEGHRVVIQSCSSSKDKDALGEFLKNIFIQQQQNNFLDLEDN